MQILRSVRGSRWSGTEADLPASLDLLCAQPEHLQGTKLLLIFDQFEQWLHGNKIGPESPLIAALRHCDGGRVQGLLMVRDDFFLGISRFMGELARPIQQGINTAFVDLFDETHARKVLSAFGQAYNKLEVDDHAAREFLNEAVRGLADDKDRVVAVHLALFADLFRNKEWTTEALRKIGGSTGVGREFLEENFDRSAGNPTLRTNRKAAIAILRKLLPPPGTQIVGTKQSLSELRRAATDAQPNCQFDPAFNLLVQSLRLVAPAPADDEDGPHDGPAIAESCYQLTHDYLVPALRDSLTANDRCTRHGRARILLEERAEQWQRDQQVRNLPLLPELAIIWLFIPRRQQTPAQRKFVRHAQRWHARRAAMAGAVVSVVLSIILSKFAFDFCTFQGRVTRPL